MDERSDDSAVVTRQFDTESADPNVEVVSVIADLEERRVEDLPPLYNCIDHVLEHLFENPPSESASMVVSFSYQNYRITIEQDGTARFERSV